MNFNLQPIYMYCINGEKDMDRCQEFYVSFECQRRPKGYPMLIVYMQTNKWREELT